MCDVRGIVIDQILLLDKMLVNLPIEQADLEYHEVLDKLVFSFGDEVKCKEIKGKNGAEILVYCNVLYGIVVSKFSSFEESDLSNPVRLFSNICLKRPEFAITLFKLIRNFEIDQVCRKASKNTH